jgi:hypothetical protein
MTVILRRERPKGVDDGLSKATSGVGYDQVSQKSARTWWR